MRAVPAAASISDMVCSGAWGQLPRADRHAIFEAVVRMLDRIHAAGLAWRGISSRDIYPQRVSAGRWELWLIDCEGVHQARSRSVRECDLRKLERALRYDRADAATISLVREISGRTTALRQGRRSREPGADRRLVLSAHE